MRKTFIFFLLWCSVFAATDTRAQGWAWGKGSTGAGFDSWAVTTDGAGNVYGAGYAFSTGTVAFGSVVVPASTSSTQTVWVKYNSAGTVLWAGGTASGDVYPYNIASDPAGNLIVFGSFSSATMQIGSFTLSATGGDYFIAKINPSGVVMWATNAGTSTGSYLGLSGVYIMSTGGITTDTSGNIYITSSFNGSMTIGSSTLASSGSDDIFVAKYSPSGFALWATSIGGSGSDYGFGIAVASTGNVYITGAFYSPSISVGSSVIINPYSSSSSATPYAYIAEFSSATGSHLWAQAAGGENGAFGVGLARDNFGNVYMTGGFADTSISFGSTTISQTYPVATGKFALYLIQYSSANVVTWSKTIGSPVAGVWGYSIALASCGQVWVSGNYMQDVNIDGNTLALVPGTDAVFIAGYNLSGGVVGYAGLGSGGDDQNGIAADGSGNIYMCSDYEASVVIGPDALPAIPGSEHFYMAKYANISGVAPDTNYTHQDTIICAFDSLILTAPTGYSVYYWDDSNVQRTRTVTAPGTYWVCSSTCGAAVSFDTFYVTLKTSDTTFSRKDTSVCTGLDSARLTAPAGYSSYLWASGDTISFVTANTAGNYIVTCYRGCNLLIDTFGFSLTANDTTFHRTDTSACASVGVVPETLTAPPGYTTYTWSTGSTATSIIVDTAGNYILYGLSGCSVISDTFHYTIAPNDTIFTSKDTNACATFGTMVLHGPPGYTHYAWSNSVVAPSVTIFDPNTYILYAYAGCNFLVDTFYVTVKPDPTVFIGNDTVINDNDPLTLFAAEPPGYIYLWNDRSTLPSIFVSTPGTYWIRVTNKWGCSATDTIHVYDTAQSQIQLPNAFSPLGANNVFKPIVKGNVDLRYFRIYDRWGVMVFETIDVNEGWDGKYKGVLQPLAVYVYQLEAILNNGSTFRKKGNVTLIR